MPFAFDDNNTFTITIEAVPPADHDPTALLKKMNAVSGLDFHGFSIASNPVAKPRMSAMAFCRLVREATGKPAILHVTVRDHNRLGLESELYGARALGIDTVICLTGDPSGRKAEHPAVTVADVNVFELITMARQAGLSTGAVLDYRPEINGLDNEVKRLKRKAEAGAEFIVTQPVYDEKTAQKIHDAAAFLNLPVIMGILPLVSPRHAEFLHNKVAGIAVPDTLRTTMAQARDPLSTGTAQARDMLALAREQFSGACIMPPFDRFEILTDILD